MRKLTFATSFTAALLLAGPAALSVDSPRGVTGPIGATATEIGRGDAHHAGTFTVAPGDNVVFQSVVLAPGKAIAWQAERAVVIVKSGDVMNHPNCAEAEGDKWGAANAFVMEKGANLTMNHGKQPAEFIAVFVSDPTELPAACPTASDGIEVTNHGEGKVAKAGEFSIESGKRAVVQHFGVDPGYSTGWHRHPDTNLILQTKGQLVNYQDCETKEVWEPGYVYPHMNSEHHDAHPYLSKNESEERAEALVILFNAPPDSLGAQAPLTPIAYTPPPQECPTKF